MLCQIVDISCLARLARSREIKTKVVRRSSTKLRGRMAFIVCLSLQTSGVVSRGVRDDIRDDARDDPHPLIGGHEARDVAPEVGGGGGGVSTGARGAAPLRQRAVRR
jgi:hypothetical protein